MKTLIIIVSIIAIGATVAVIVVGGRSFDGLVVEKPYESGLDWDRSEQQRSVLGWRVTLNATDLKAGPNDLGINVIDKSGARLRDADVIVRLTRPETAGYDHVYQAMPRPDGTYHAAVTLPLRGNWQAVVTVARGNDRMAYTLPLSVSGGPHADGIHP